MEIFTQFDTYYIIFALPRLNLSLDVPYNYCLRIAQLRLKPDVPHCDGHGYYRTGFTPLTQIFHFTQD